MVKKFLLSFLLAAVLSISSGISDSAVASAQDIYAGELNGDAVYVISEKVRYGRSAADRDCLYVGFKEVYGNGAYKDWNITFRDYNGVWSHFGFRSPHNQPVESGSIEEAILNVALELYRK